MRFSLKKHVSDVVFIVVVLILVARFLSISEVRPMPVSVVMSGSMEPTLSRGDVIFWHPCKISDVRVGDIIVYKSYIEKDKYVLHRVIDIRVENGEILLATKGDANEFPDQSGPHIVEPYIRENHFLGKAVGVGSLPLKIPLVGNLFIALGDLTNSISKSITSAGTPFAVAPLVVPAIAFVLLLFMWEDGGAKKYKKLNLILGPDKVRVRRVFLYTFVAFLAMMLSTLLFANSIVTVSAGVGEEPEPANLEVTLPPNATKTQEVTITNDGFLPLKCVVFMDGDIKEIGAVSRNVMVIQGGKYDTISTTFFAYSTTKPGVYNGKIVAYSSPFWVVLPDDFITALLDYNPYIAVILLDIVSGLVFAVLVVVVMLLLSLLVDEILLWGEYLGGRFQIRKIQMGWTDKVKAVVREKTSKVFGFLIKIDWIKVKGKKIAGQAALISVPFFPVALFSLPVAILSAAVLVTLIFFRLGCRYRAEFYLGSLTSTLLITIFVYLYPQIFSMPVDFTSLLIVGAVSLLLYLVFLFPVLLVSYITAKTIFYILEEKYPELMFEGDV
ncbi:MAG: signal peptidase I [Thermoplasmata archaeon]|nr:signal peptidase I [Thermoplasmata archaeon]